MLTKAFWLAVTERAVKSAAQAAVLVIGAEQVNAVNVDWAQIGGFALGGFVLSVLTSIGSGVITSTPGPSLTGAEVIQPQP